MRQIDDPARLRRRAANLERESAAAPARESTLAFLRGVLEEVVPRALATPFRTQEPKPPSPHPWPKRRPLRSVSSQLNPTGAAELHRGALVALGQPLMLHFFRFRCSRARLQKPPRLLDRRVLPTHLRQVCR